MIPRSVATPPSKMRAHFFENTVAGRRAVNELTDPYQEYKYPSPELLQPNLIDFIANQSLDAETLMRHFSNSGQRIYDGQYHILRSAGGRTSYAYWLYDHVMWEAFVDAVRWHLELLGVHERDRIAFIGSSDIRHTLTNVAQDLCYPNSTILGLQYPIYRVCDELVAFDPSVVVGYGSAIGHLATFHHRSLGHIRPRVVVTNTDALFREEAESVRSLWGATPRNQVFSTELGLLLFECPEGGLHANDSHVGLERRNDRVFATNLVNKIQPIINLEIPLGFPSQNKQCQCGIRHPLANLANAGRRHGWLSMPAGPEETVCIHPIVLRSAFDSRRELRGVSWSLAGEVLTIQYAGNISADEICAVTRDALRDAGVDIDRIEVNAAPVVQDS